MSRQIAMIWSIAGNALVVADVCLSTPESPEPAAVVVTQLAAEDNVQVGATSTEGGGY